MVIVSGKNPFTYFNTATPQIFTWAVENKIYAALILFFLSNAVETQLISTGAFEVTFNDVPVWSKLETGRIPSPQEIFQIIDNNMRLNS
jgi:selT/selW/selH-like putative selenoprotein